MNAQMGVRFGVVALVAAAGFTVWRVATRNGETDRSMAASSGDSAGMDGMDGMQMGGDGSVQLSATQLRQFGITFGTAEVRTLQHDVRTVGVITFDETRLVEVTPKVGGFVERLHVDFTGRAVNRGEPLLEIYSPELVAAQEELLVAERLERTMNESIVPGVPAGKSDLLAAARRRLQLWDISDEQIEAILRSGEARRTLTLHAPASGVVLEKRVTDGQSVQAGQTLYRIADLSVVWIEPEIQESDAGSVRVGSTATIELAAFPGRPVQGRVEFVYPTMQESTRRLRTRVAVPNPEGRLKPGMYATVRLTTPTRRALTVPASAIIRTGERSVVFVEMDGGTLMPHEVETGSIGAQYAEILTGVESGQRVVTSAQFLLDSESNLAEVMRAMMGQMSTGDVKPMGR